MALVNGEKSIMERYLCDFNIIFEPALSPLFQLWFTGGCI